MSNNETVRAVLNFALKPVYAVILLHHDIQYGRTRYTVKEWF